MGIPRLCKTKGSYRALYVVSLQQARQKCFLFYFQVIYLGGLMKPRFAKDNTPNILNLYCCQRESNVPAIGLTRYWFVRNMDK